MKLSHNFLNLIASLFLLLSHNAFAATTEASHPPHIKDNEATFQVCANNWVWNNSYAATVCPSSCSSAFGIWNNQWTTRTNCDNGAQCGCYCASEWTICGQQCCNEYQKCVNGSCQPCPSNEPYGNGSTCQQCSPSSFYCTLDNQGYCCPTAACFQGTTVCEPVGALGKGKPSAPAPKAPASPSKK